MILRGADTEKHLDGRIYDDVAGLERCRDREREALRADLCIKREAMVYTRNAQVHREPIE